MTTTDPIVSSCRLCGLSNELRRSHVIPRFVFKWLKDTSPGFLRTVNQPNQRVQDGPTEYWLCGDCEQRFSDWERPFAERVFQYVHTTSAEQKPVPYGEWAMKFAASISWRTLICYRDQGFTHLSPEDLEALEHAERVWREFLLGKRPHPAQFEQHIILVDAPAEVSGPVSPFLNRYLLRTVQSDLITSKSMCITYTKLCRIIVIGFIRVDLPKRWKGTKVRLRGGTLGGDVEVPSLLMTYWNDKADQSAAAFSAMSEKQTGKIDEMFDNADPDVLAQSEVFRAMRADVAFSGERAFSATGRTHENKKK